MALNFIIKFHHHKGKLLKFSWTSQFTVHNFKAVSR